MEIRSHEENEERRQSDAQDRAAGRIETPFVDAENGEPIRIHVVSWVNSTIWRVAVAAALFASLFSIYDNSERVKRLEGQVCATLTQSESTLDTLEYYREHPDEREEARKALQENKRRFHCPVPESPVIPSAMKFLR